MITGVDVVDVMFPDMSIGQTGMYKGRGTDEERILSSPVDSSKNLSFDRKFVSSLAVLKGIMGVGFCLPIAFIGRRSLVLVPRLAARVSTVFVFEGRLEGASKMFLILETLLTGLLLESGI